jgi:hypothetical protein
MQVGQHKHVSKSRSVGRKIIFSLRVGHHILRVIIFTWKERRVSPSRQVARDRATYPWPYSKMLLKDTSSSGMVIP